MALRFKPRPNLPPIEHFGVDDAGVPQIYDAVSEFLRKMNNFLWKWSIYYKAKWGHR